MINQFLNSILRCPVSHSRLEIDDDSNKLVSAEGITYDIIYGIPVMLYEKQVNQDEFNYRGHYALDAELFDYFEERTGGTEHDERRVREYILHSIRHDVASILDVGCGKAWLAREMIRKKTNIVSLDISLQNPKKAMELYPSEFHSAVVSDALKLPFADEVFDCVVSSEVIEHLTNPGQMINELLRVLKPEGRLIVTTPYKERLRYSLCIHCNQKTPVNAHLHSFDENKLCQLGNESVSDFSWALFGNKALMHLRMHFILKYMPFRLWNLKDKFFNWIINKPAHIIAIYTKKQKADV